MKFGVFEKDQFCPWFITWVNECTIDLYYEDDKGFFILG
jgi:hypothetical protein